MPEPKPYKRTAADELHVRLDIAGLAALMKTIEAAMAGGRGELRLGWSGVVVTGGGPTDGFRSLTVTYTETPGPNDKDERAGPVPRAPVLESQG